MKQTGIWLDKNKAIIIKLDNETETLKTITSDIDDYHVTSYKSHGGAQEISKDSKYLEREKHQFKSYFKDIISWVKDSDSIVIFGPAQTNEKFNKELMAHHKDLAKRVTGVKKADSMSDNQVMAWVKDFFLSSSTRSR